MIFKVFCFFLFFILLLKEYLTEAAPNKTSVPSHCRWDEHVNTL